MTDRNSPNADSLTQEEKELLEAFKARRARSNAYIQAEALDLTSCPSCGFPSFSDDWFHDICAICNWQHDGQDDPDADEVTGGPNYELSLTASRLKIGKILQEKAAQKGGKIVTEPEEVVAILGKSAERMAAFTDDMMMDALQDDPVWVEWRKAKLLILDDLISERQAEE